MNLQDLTEEVDRVISLAGDPESFHGEEDELMERWITENAPSEVVEQFRRLWRGDFTRWYA